MACREETVTAAGVFFFFFFGGGGVSKYFRKTYKSPGHRVSSAAELIQSALLLQMIAWRAKCD